MTNPSAPLLFNSIAISLQSIKIVQTLVTLACKSPISKAEIPELAPRGEFCEASSFSEVEPRTTLPRLNFPSESLELRNRSKSDMELALPDRGVFRGASRGESWIISDSQTVEHVDSDESTIDAHMRNFEILYICTIKSIETFAETKLSWSK